MGTGSEGASRGPHRLNAVEGLRGYLALWVLVCHVLWAAGFEVEALSGLPRLLRRGEYAVDVFVIVSGFVIFLSLDTRRESYKQFIVRRFFRLFPLFILLFALAIPLSGLSIWNAAHAGQYLTPNQAQYLIDTIGMWWQNIDWHVPLHLLMMHGTVPGFLVPHAPSAFLMSAWSVSLEWQFYLIAPLAYALAVSSERFQRLGLCVICLLLLLSARYVFPPVPLGAALPFHIEFFFLGAASYFVYKRRPAWRLSNAWFPVAGCVSVFLLMLHGNPLIPIALIPIAAWTAFLGVILEQPDSSASSVVSPLFTSRPIQYLGRISYSVYLSHMLVIVLLQYALLAWAPQLSRMTHFAVLLSSTLAATIMVSSLLYRFVEAPGIKLGRSLARDFAGRGGVGTSVANAVPQRSGDSRVRYTLVPPSERSTGLVRKRRAITRRTSDESIGGFRSLKKIAD